MLLPPFGSPSLALAARRWDKGIKQALEVLLCRNDLAEVCKERLQARMLGPLALQTPEYAQGKAGTVVLCIFTAMHVTGALPVFAGLSCNFIVK